jgi:hypothetical protein
LTITLSYGIIAAMQKKDNGKKNSEIDFSLFFNEEQAEWMKLTPQQRYIESCKLWSTYLALGGSLDPEPDSQSPFNFPELECAVPADGRSGVHFVRRR